MIIFTVTNQVSGQVYVGYTRNDLKEQWQKIISAAEENLDFPLYSEIRTYGAEQFAVDEYDYAESRDEVKEIEEEIIRLYNARSLRGYKTSNLIIKKKMRRRASPKKEDKALKKLFAVNPLDDPTINDALILEPTEKQEASVSKASSADKTKRVIKQQTITADSKIDNTVSTIEDNAATGSASLYSSTPVSTEIFSHNPAAEIPTPNAEHWGNNRTTIQTDPADLSKNLDSQLKAIQAAANALLSGDIQTAQHLTNITEMVTLSADEASIETASSIEETTSQPPETTVTLTPLQQQITEAVARQREKQAARTTASIQAQRNNLQSQLLKLMNKAQQIRAD